MPGKNLKWKKSILNPFRDIIGRNGIVTTDDLFGGPPDNDDPSDKLLHDPIEIRSLVFGDTHFRSKLSCAPELAQFLHHVKFVSPPGKRPFIAINGDFIEGRKAGGSFSNAESVVVQKVLRASRKGTDVVIIPGNHDRFFNELADTFITPNMAVKKQVVHQTLGGKNLLVKHTDDFDFLVRSHTLEWVGTHAKEHLVKVSVALDNLRQYRPVNRLFGALGMGKGWSLAHAILGQADGASYSEGYIEAATAYMHSVNAEIFQRHKHDPKRFRPTYIDGMVGNHTHVAVERTFASPIDSKTGEFMGPPTVTYYNSGHWTLPPRGKGAEGEIYQTRHPTRTALVEYPSGKVGHVQWVPGKGIVPLYLGGGRPPTPESVAHLLDLPKQSEAEKIRMVV